VFKTVFNNYVHFLKYSSCLPPTYERLHLKQVMHCCWSCVKQYNLQTDLYEWGSITMSYNGDFFMYMTNDRLF